MSSARLDEIDRRPGRPAGDDLDLALSSRLGEVASTLTGALDTTQARLYEHLESQSGAMTQRFASTSSKKMVRFLSHPSEAMFLRIDTAARDLGKRFDVAASMLEEVTGEVVDKMDGAGGRLRQDAR